MKRKEKLEEMEILSKSEHFNLSEDLMNNYKDVYDSDGEEEEENALLAPIPVLQDAIDGLYLYFYYNQSICLIDF